MLRDKGLTGQSAALEILAASKDKQALPEIRRLMKGPKSFRHGQAVEALLSIEDSPQSREETLALLANNDPLDVNQHVLRGIVAASIPVDAKVSLLLAARAKLARPFELPRILGSTMYADQDIAELLIPLMDKETDLLCLGGYCEAATLDQQRRPAPQIRLAMKLLAGDPAVAAGGKTASPQTRAGRRRRFWIRWPRMGSTTWHPNVRRLMNSDDAAIRGDCRPPRPGWAWSAPAAS